MQLLIEQVQHLVIILHKTFANFSDSRRADDAEWSVTALPVFPTSNFGPPGLWEPIPRVVVDTGGEPSGNASSNSLGKLQMPNPDIQDRQHVAEAIPEQVTTYQDAYARSNRSSEDAAPATRSIILAVKDEHAEIHLKIRRCTPLEILMDAYCSRQGRRREHVVFMAAGRPIKPIETSEELGLADQSLVEVFESRQMESVSDIAPRDGVARISHAEVDAKFDAWVATRKQT